MPQLSIDLKSFDYSYSKNSIDKIFQIISCLTVNRANRINKAIRTPMPTVRKRFTIIRSPHIYKKSREQFEIRRYKTQINIKFNNHLVGSKLVYLLKNALLPGIEVQVLVHYSCFFIKN